jgi:hypothetical protein
MSVNEIQALAQKFADAFDRRDIKTVLNMLADDVEVFDTVPYRVRRQASFCQVSRRGFRGYRLSLPGRLQSPAQREARARELKITTFSAYGDALDNTPDLELADPKAALPDTNLLVTDEQLSLFCMWRRVQR